MVVAAYLQEHVMPCLTGKDPLLSGDIWQFLHAGAALLIVPDFSKLNAQIVLLTIS